jgi:hypothetical protein
MKKLLALILCVVMVLSFSATAFAAGTTGGEAEPFVDEDGYLMDRWPAYMSAAAAKKTVTDLGKDIKAMYTAIAADEAVFATAKGIYSMTDSLANELLKDIEKVTFLDENGVKYNVYNEDLVSNVRKGLNHIIGDEIANYLNDRVDAFTNSDGNVQPEKYLNTFVKAVNNAFTSTKGQKNIEALVYGLAALNTQIKVNERADDLYNDITEWDHWKEFYWTIGYNKDGEIVPTNVQNPDPDAGNGGYTWTWLPTQAWNNTVLVPTGSQATAGDAALAAAVLEGLFN